MSDRIELLIRHLDSHRLTASIPESAHQAARVWMQDSLSVALAGRAVPQSAQLLAAVRKWGSADDMRGAHVWGSNERLPAQNAALLNAFHVHNQEFDCVHERAVVHPMAVIFAALLSYAESRSAHEQISGEKFTAALILAVDVATVIGMSARRAVKFFRPAQCGCLGAVAGLAVLADVEGDKLRDAFGLAYSQLAGTMQAHIEGTPTLPLQVGFAARSAICAFDLALQGFRAPHQILDGKYGYFKLFEPDAIEPDHEHSPFLELGTVWQVEFVSHKPFPTGRAAQGGIAGLRELMRIHGFGVDNVEKILVFAPPLVRQLVDRPMQPSMNVNYARLCMPYLLATTLRFGTVGLDDFRGEAFADPATLAIATRVAMYPDGNSDVNALRPQRIEVNLKSGDSFVLDIPYVYGAPEVPMNRDEQFEKFLACCRHAPNSLGNDEVERLYSAIDRVKALSDINDLIELTIPAGK